MRKIESRLSPEDRKRVTTKNTSGIARDVYFDSHHIGTVYNDGEGYKFLFMEFGGKSTGSTEKVSYESGINWVVNKALRYRVLQTLIVPAPRYHTMPSL